jgi:hypothetical protein
MAVAGVIAERARGIIPVTWDALSRDTARFGETQLRIAVDSRKDEIFGAVVAPAAESAYPLMVISYVAKLVALDLLDPGIDYWRNEPISVSATGTNENTTYTDPVVALEALRKSLLEQTRREWPLVKPLIPFTRVTNAPRARINTLDEEFLTPSPQEFPRPYRVTERS